MLRGVYGGESESGASQGQEQPCIDERERSQPRAYGMERAQDGATEEERKAERKAGRSQNAIGQSILEWGWREPLRDACINTYYGIPLLEEID